MDVHLHNDAVTSLASLVAFWHGFDVESLQLRAELDGIHVEEDDVGCRTGLIKAVLPAALFPRYKVEPGFTLCVESKSLSAVLAALVPENVVMRVAPEKRSSLVVEGLCMKDVGGVAQMITVEHELSLRHPSSRDALVSSVRYDRVARLRMDDFKQYVAQATATMEEERGVIQLCMDTCLRLVVDQPPVKSTVLFELGQLPMRAYADTDPLRDDDERRLDQGVQVGLFYRPRTSPTSGSYTASFIQHIASYEETEYIELFQTEHGFLVIRFDARHNVRIALSPLAP